jgi:ribonucleoside-diphosphate reductase alpha chain
VTKANVSVRLSDEFLTAVEKGEKYQMRWPCDPSRKPIVEEWVDAREIWDEINQYSRDSAEPGLLFWDHILRQSPADCYADEGFRTITTNPCAEIPLSGGDACRLLLVNLSRFVQDPFTENARFEWERLHDVTKKAQRLMDDLVDIELEQVGKILAKIEDDPEPPEVKAVELGLWQKIRESGRNGRRTGLGVTAVGDTIAMLGHRYGSDESIELVEKIYRALAVASYESSIDLAAERGCFPVYDYRKERGHPFIERVLEAGGDGMRERYERYGRRNIANLTTAPTGSVSLLTQTSSGIEPVFRALYTRRKKVDIGNPDARVDYVDSAGDSWSEYTVRHYGFVRWQEVTGKGDDDFSESPYSGAEALDLDWNQRVRFQAAATRWLDHAVSSTINLPEDVSVETVKEIHNTAWRSGCKGITTYRENSRDGVLVEKREFLQHNAPKRPDRLPCDIHRSRVKRDDGEYEDWIIFVGLFEGRPYEIFGGSCENIELPKKVTEGHIVKRPFKSGGKYDLYYGEEDDPLKIKDIVRQFDNADRGWATRMISLALRHGSPPQYLVEQLQHDKEADLYDFAKALARVLKKYIQDGTTSGRRVCPACEARESLRYQEGCLLCISCGYSKCM